MYLIFTIVRDIKIPPLTKKELDNLATNIPKMAEVTVQSLTTKLQDINRNYPYTMPGWLKNYAYCLLHCNRYYYCSSDTLC